MKIIASLCSAKLLALCFLLASHLASAQQPSNAVLPHAQVPGDTLPGPPPLLDSLSYRLFGDGSFTRGNVTRSLVVVRAEVTLSGPVLSIATNPRFSYGKQDGVLAERDTYADLFVDVFKKSRTYVFGLATVEVSNLRGIELRRLAGAGIGYRLLRSDRHTLTLTNALIHESTDFRERPTLVTQRNSLRVKGSHAFVGNRVQVSHVTFVQPSLQDFSNLRWNTLISLELPLTERVSIRASFANSYESEVEASRRHNDSHLTFGLSLGNRP